MPHTSKSSARQEELYWRLPDGLCALPTDVTLGLEGTVKHLRPQSQRLTFHDTYDFDLYHAGRILVQAGDRLLLCPCDRLSTRSALAVHPLAAGMPQHIGEFPPGGMAQQLAAATCFDRLFPVAQAVRRVFASEYQDSSGEIVVRFRVEMYHAGNHASGEPVCAVLRTQARTDAGPAATVFFQRLREAGLSPIGGPDTGDAILPRLIPLDAHLLPRPDPSLLADGPSREGVFRLGLAMLRQARRYEAGIIDDADPECLHQYRVKLRRLRSLLGLMRPVLAKGDAAPLREALRDMARRTNRLRDLDVLLKSAREHSLLVPEELREGLESVLAAAAAQRSRERARVVRYLQSKRYGEAVAHVQFVLSDPESCPTTDDSAKPLRDVAIQRLRKQCRRLLRSVDRAFKGEPTDEALHAVRIVCKKVRYLIEEFGIWCHPEALPLVVKACRRLQTALGNVNDLALQRRQMMTLLNDPDAGQPTSAAEAAALGALVAALDLRQRDWRERAFARLSRLRAGRTRKAVKSLCSQPEAAKHG